MKLGSLALAFPFFAGQALATTVVTARSARDKPLTLTFPDDEITAESVEAVLCRTPATRLTEAVLWMSADGHNHGSTPTTLTQRSDGCTDITDIDFSMDGRWQIKVKFADGDKGVLNVDVE